MVERDYEERPLSRGPELPLLLAALLTRLSEPVEAVRTTASVLSEVGHPGSRRGLLAELRERERDLRDVWTRREGSLRRSEDER